MNKKKKTPTLAKWLVSQSIPPFQLEEFLGDLRELYEERMETKGEFLASICYWMEAFHLMIGFSSLSSFKIQNNRMTMLKSYLKIAYRNMQRYKFYTAINVIGLAVGISMSLLIAIHVSTELSYEKTYPRHQQIYRLASTNWAKKPPFLATEFKKEMPEVKEVGRLFSMQPSTLAHENNELLIKRPFLGDPSILDMFDIQFIEGSHDALDDPSTVVLTESTADRLFQSGENQIGEMLDFDDGWKVKVVGIIKDFPKNSHLKIDCIISSKRTFVERDVSRSWSGVSIFALFETTEDVKKVESKLLDFYVQFLNGEATREEVIEEGNFLELHPITDIHLHSHREKEIEANSDITYVYVFSALAVFILLVVIINFINLYVAQTLNRIKEIGLRKALGAYRGQLAFQFLAEAFFLLFSSGLLALGIAYLSLPFYNELASIPILRHELFSSRLLGILLALTFIVAGLAGGYPAFYLSRFEINEGLNKKGLKISSKLPLRTAMVAFQFLISICLFTATLIVSKQMNFIESKDMGFAKEEVIAIKLHGKLKEEALLYTDKMRSELTKHAGILQISFSSHLIGSRFSLEPFYLKSRPQDQLSSRVIVADTKFLETMGITVVDGGLKTEDFTGRKYFFNETAARLLQRDNVLGEIGYNTWQKNEGEVIGIVKDFHFASLHKEVDPLVIHLSNEDGNAINYMLIRIRSGDIASTVQTIETTLEKLAPGALIVPQLIDEHMDSAYLAEKSIFSIFRLFSAIIIGLACVGLFALFAFVAQARTKEMGIRKTLGASLSQLLLIMTKSYMSILIIIAIVAIPLVKYLASGWLESFAFRTTLNWWHFALPGLTVLTLAAFAILMQSWKVAVRNPVDSLKDE